MYRFLFLFLLLPAIIVAAGRETVNFPSGDGLIVTADLYMAHDDKAPFIVLFHQAGWSRGEYLEIAPELNRLGFNCMAIDQRSGGAVNDVENRTFTRARKAGKGVTYLDAFTDMLAAVDYARGKFAQGKLIIWGSSYSAALVLRLAGEYPEKTDGVLAFSPGEYFTRFGKSETFITEAAAKINVPVFITSAKPERKQWASIFKAIPSRTKTSFLPQSEGHHGSRALWNKWNDSRSYWTAVTSFLKKNFLY